MSKDNPKEQAYALAREAYARVGVDTERAMEKLDTVALSVHCWQGDDVGGFEEGEAGGSGGGIQVTGHYPGRARMIGELRRDLEAVFSLIPGKHRLNLHAMYGDFRGRKAGRDSLEPAHFTGWVEWAEKTGVKLDFNATCFSHPMAESGFTLSSPDAAVRSFWIEHVQRCREISRYIGEAQRSPCVHNLWIPDGFKDLPADRRIFRDRLLNSLDSIYSKSYPSCDMKDSVESKLFGIGVEEFVVGSFEFYLGYALTRKIMICLDMGHFHPTESVGDKITALLPYFPEILLHISRGVRWDSDHVVILRDDLLDLTREIVRSGTLNRFHLALDFFDASINRVGAWIVGARATLKALLTALLEPHEKLVEMETDGNLFGRLALMEAAKTLPMGAVWDIYCMRKDAALEERVIPEVMRYEREVLSKRE
jgi:L-rhamnose isomerase